MRVAEICMALVMAIFSIYLMWKSTELPIGWIEGEGPGGGGGDQAQAQEELWRQAQVDQG